MKNITENLTNLAIKQIGNTIAIKKISWNLNIFLMSVGIISNVISLYAFLQKSLLKRKFNWYLLVLTAFELIFCSLLFVDYLFVKVYKQPLFLHDLSEFSLQFFDFTVHTIDSCIVILTLVLSVDRLYAIENPMKIKLFVTCLHAKFVIFFSLTSLIVLKISSFAFCEYGFKSAWYCALISPLIFNIVPLFIICALNSALVIKMMKYYQLKKGISIGVLARESFCLIELKNQTRRNCFTTVQLFKSSFQSHRCRTSASSLWIQSVNNKKKLTKSQKSHYLVILVSGMWIILTSIVYYTFNSYFSLNTLDKVSDFFSLKTARRIQIISSILFNLNHSINFFIYFSFHKEFRNVILNSFNRKTVSKSIKVMI